MTIASNWPVLRRTPRIKNISGNKGAKTMKTKTDYALQALNQALETLLWSEVGDTDEPLDSNYDIDDISDDVKTELLNDIVKFETSHHALLGDMSASDLGHDFILTRNEHGAGFWARGLGEIGEALTSHCKQYGSINLYVGDDGKLYS
jgi:hypothetical protein